MLKPATDVTTIRDKVLVEAVAAEIKHVAKQLPSLICSTSYYNKFVTGEIVESNGTAVFLAWS